MLSYLKDESTGNAPTGGIETMQLIKSFKLFIHNNINPQRKKERLEQEIVSQFEKKIKSNVYKFVMYKNTSIKVFDAKGIPQVAKAKMKEYVTECIDKKDQGKILQYNRSGQINTRTLGKYLFEWVANNKNKNIAA